MSETHESLQPDEISDGPPHEAGACAADTDYETVTSTAKVMRIGSMVKQLLE